MKSESEMTCMVETMIGELMKKIEREVPDEGDFPMIYTDFNERGLFRFPPHGSMRGEAVRDGGWTKMPYGINLK